MGPSSFTSVAGIGAAGTDHWFGPRVGYAHHASVFVNDHESGLWQDILKWLEETVAPWAPDRYRHNETGEDNAAAHLRSLTIGHEVMVPITQGALDLGPWQRVFYGAWDGRRRKRVIVKVLGE